MIRYPSLVGIALRLVIALVGKKKLSLTEEGRRWVSRFQPPLEILGTGNIPTTGPCLVTFNHYSRPGFRAWWMSLAISSVLPVDAHWIMTSTLTYPDFWRAHSLTPASRWLLPKIASTYNMTPMPPMPPRPQDVADRAHAVRQILLFARQRLQPVLCLAPEGGDAPGGALQMPPSGSGRFIWRLAELGLEIVPLGVYESDTQLRLHFGKAYSLLQKIHARSSMDIALDKAGSFSTRWLDRIVAQIVMGEIAALLPEQLRGDISLFR